MQACLTDLQCEFFAAFLKPLFECSQTARHSFRTRLKISAKSADRQGNGVHLILIPQHKRWMVSGSSVSRPASFRWSRCFPDRCLQYLPFHTGARKLLCTSSAVWYWQTLIWCRCLRKLLKWIFVHIYWQHQYTSTTSQESVSPRCWWKQVQ